MLGTSRVVAAVLVSSVLAGTVMAQPKAPTPAEKRQAGDLVKQAIVKSQEKEHLAAIELYLKAYAVVPLPTLLSNVGTEYQQAAKPVEALKYFCLYLEKDPAGALVTYATSQARVLQIQLGNTVNNDAEVCTPPEAPPPPPPPPDEGAGSGAAPPPAIIPVIEPARTDPGGSLKLAGAITGGVGLATFGLGFYFGIQAKKINDDIEDQGMTEPWRNDIVAYMDKGQRYEYMQIGFLVAGGALVVGGTVMYMLGDGKTSAAESQTQVTIAPSVTPGGGGVTFSGRF